MRKQRPILFFSFLLSPRLKKYEDNVLFLYCSSRVCMQKVRTHELLKLWHGQDFKRKQYRSFKLFRPFLYFSDLNISMLLKVFHICLRPWLKRTHKAYNNPNMIITVTPLKTTNKTLFVCRRILKCLSDFKTILFAWKKHP